MSDTNEYSYMIKFAEERQSQANNIHNNKNISNLNLELSKSANEKNIFYIAANIIRDGGMDLQ